MPRAGDAVGPFTLETRLGAGGFGEVWKAVDGRIGRHVAVKLLKHAEPADLERFRREALITARLEHASIASIYEVGFEPPYLAMQFVDGVTLRAWGRGRRDPKTAVRLLRDAARAIGFAHEHGVLHRDLKPENLMLAKDGRVVVMDFGLARQVGVDSSISQSGWAIGTPSYMSPEQARGEVRVVDARSDVWGLGATLYDLLAGRPPFDGPTSLEILMQVIESDPAPTGAADPALEAVVMKCLAKERGRRYATAAELADDLDRWLGHVPVRAKPASKLGRGAIAAAAVAALVVAAVAGALLLRGRDQSTAQTKEASVRRLRETSRTCLDAALTLRRAGKLEAMDEHVARLRAVCLDAAREMPASAEPHVLLAEILLAQLREPEAERELQLAIQKEPGHEMARYRLGVLRMIAYDARMTELMMSRRVPALAWERLRLVEDDEARRLRASALELLSARSSALSRWFQASLNGGQPQEFVALFAEVVREAEDDEFVWKLRADKLIQEQHYDEALQLIEEGLRHDAGYLKLRARGAEVLLALAHRAGDPGPLSDRAIEDLRMVTRTTPSVGWVWSKLAMGYRWRAMACKRRGGDFEATFRAAEEANAKAIALGVPAARVVRLLLLLEWAQAQWRAGKDGEPLATQVIEEATALTADPKAEPSALRCRAEARLEIARDRKDARGFDLLLAAAADARRALELGSTDSALWQLLAHAEYLRGQILKERGDAGHDEALTQAERATDSAIAADPAVGRFRLDRGMILTARAAREFDRGKDAIPTFEKALRDFDDAKRLDPDESSHDAGRAELLAAWGTYLMMQRQDGGPRFRQAVEEADQLLERDPGFVAARRVRRGARANLAVLAIWKREDPTDDLKKAIADAGTVAEASGTIAADWVARGRLRCDLATWLASTGGEPAADLFDGARADFEKALSLAPGDVEAMVHLGGALLNIGMLKERAGGESAKPLAEAATILEKGIAADPQRAMAWSYLGSVRLWQAERERRTGERDPSSSYRAALAAFDRAEELDPRLSPQLRSKRGRAEEFLKK